MELTKIQFEDGQLVSGPYVEIDGVKYPVQKAKYQGKTPLSSRNLNKLQDNIGTAISDLDERVVSYRNVLVDQSALIKECGGLKLKKLNKLEGREIEQETREGYNLLDVNFNTQTLNGLTFTKNSDKSVTIKGTATASTGIKIGEATFEAGTHTFYCKGMKYERTDARLEIKDKNNTTLSSLYLNVEKTTITLTEAGTVELEAIVLSGRTVDFTFYPMALNGTYTNDNLPEYEQYGATPTPNFPSPVKTATGNVEVKIGNKNLLSIPEFTETKNGITLTYNKGVVTLKGKATETKTVFFNTHKVASVKAGKTYYFDRKVSDSNQYATMFLGADVGGFNTEPTFSTYITKKTFDKDGDLILMVYLNNIPSGTDIDLTYKPQLEIGETATDHVEHKSQVFPLTLGDIELCKIGDYADYIYRNGSKWFKRSNIEKVVLDGNEAWEDRPDYTYADRFVAPKIFSGNIRQMYCNYFTSVNSVATNTYPYIVNNATQCVINFSAKGTTTLAQFKAWLGTHNTIVYYPLETPTDTEITDTTLIAQLNALENAKLYEGITNISITGDNLTPIADLDVWTWFKGESADTEYLQAQIDELRSMIENLSN